MAVTIAGEKLKKMTFDGQTVKKWLHDGVQVFAAELQAVVDGVLQSGVTLSNVANGSSTSSTTGATVSVTAWGGAYFGYNVSRFNTDCREYSSAEITITTSGSTGTAGYFPCFVFVGTAAQIAGVKFTAYNTVNFNGCTQLGGWFMTNQTLTFTADFSGFAGGTETVYLACIVGAYNGTNKAMTFNSVTYE